MTGESLLSKYKKMSTAKLLHACTELIRQKYPKIGDDAASVCAGDAVKRGWVAFGADGLLHCKPEIATIAPRLAPALAMSEYMSEEQKITVFRAQLARNSDRLPTSCAPKPKKMGIILDPRTDEDKVHNARFMAGKVREKLAEATDARNAAYAAEQTSRDEVREAAVAAVADAHTANVDAAQTRVQRVVAKDVATGKINIAAIRARLGDFDKLPGGDS